MKHIIYSLFIAALCGLGATFATGAAAAANECGSDAECPGSNWFCLNGQCVEQNTGARCWNLPDCPIGDDCIDDICVRRGGTPAAVHADDPNHPISCSVADDLCYRQCQGDFDCIIECLRPFNC